MAQIHTLKCPDGELEVAGLAVCRAGDVHLVFELIDLAQGQVLMALHSGLCTHPQLGAAKGIAAFAPGEKVQLQLDSVAVGAVTLDAVVRAWGYSAPHESAALMARIEEPPMRLRPAPARE